MPAARLDTAPAWPSLAVEEAFPATLAAPGQARAFVRHVAQGWQLPASLADDVTLVVSEAVTNVVRHAKTPVLVGVARDRSSLLVSIADGQVAAPGPRAAASADAEDGRGLMIIHAVASEWGVEHTTIGKRVWMRLPFPGPVPGRGDR